jgi:allantoin racemase
MSGKFSERRLLAINPNMSSGVTDAFVAQARAVAPMDTIIDGVTGLFGATIVSIEAENIIASYATLELLAKHAQGYDAVILAISFDSGLDGAREIMPIPVIGITEAALMAAAASSGAIGIVTFGAASLPLYQRLVRKYGLEEKVAGWEVVDIASTAGYLAPQAQDDAVVAAIQCLHDKGATAAVITGTAIVGMAERLQPRLGIPVFDSAVASVNAALAAIENDPHPVRTAKPLSTCKGISAELATLIAGHL